eukprot:m.188293 g.188293  ORF g.188293 m.188293 type:complete len:77 (-) comp16722_c0_seq36:966-1196(-)
MVEGEAGEMDEKSELRSIIGCVDSLTLILPLPLLLHPLPSLSAPSPPSLSTSFLVLDCRVFLLPGCLTLHDPKASR